MRKCESAVVLKTEEGFVRVSHDKNAGNYRMGIKTGEVFEWKFISEALYNLMVKELSAQKGKTS